MCAAERLGDDFVDDTEFEQIAAGKLQRAGSLIGVLLMFPQNAGAALGADDRIVGVLQDGDVVANANSQRAAGSTFADDNAQNGSIEPGHVTQIDRDLIRLAAFLSADSGVSAGGIDEANDGQLEFGGGLHFAECFAIAFGIGHAVITSVAFFEIAAFVLADEHDFVIFNFGQTDDHGMIVPERFIAV